MSIDQLVGQTFNASQFSIGTNSGTDPITYTEQDAGSDLGPNTMVTITSVSGNTFQATISGSTVFGGAANGMTTGTAIGNSAASVIATGMIAGQSGTVLLTNNAADQPGVGNSTTAPAYADNTTYTAPGAAPCYASGTLIRTERGDVVVEALRVGDMVVTASGALRPIRWLGHRTVACAAHPRSHEVLPVRVAAHAFGPERPSRPLVVSPGHAICIDVLGEVLVPAIALVNGETIVQVEADAVTYWHVELDSHDLLLAENLPAESYLDMGNRAFFREADVVALDASPDAAARRHADFCRPYVDGGPLLASIRAQLVARASAIAPQAEPAPRRSAA